MAVRDDYAYKRWKKDAKRRDKNKCQFPGCVYPDLPIEVHHIHKLEDHPELRLSSTNAICLCEHHHNSIKDKEDDYIEMFEEIVKKNSENKTPIDPLIAAMIKFYI